MWTFLFAAVLGFLGDNTGLHYNKLLTMTRYKNGWNIVHVTQMLLLWTETSQLLWQCVNNF